MPSEFEEEEGIRSGRVEQTIEKRGNRRVELAWSLETNVRTLAVL